MGQQVRDRPSRSHQSPRSTQVLRVIEVPAHAVGRTGRIELELRYVGAGKCPFVQCVACRVAPHPPPTRDGQETAPSHCKQDVLGVVRHPRGLARITTRRAFRRRVAHDRGLLTTTSALFACRAPEHPPTSDQVQVPSPRRPTARTQ